MDEQKLEELKHELADTDIQVSLVDGSFEVKGVTNSATITFTIHDEKFLNMPVSNIVVNLLEMVKK